MASFKWKEVVLTSFLGRRREVLRKDFWCDYIYHATVHRLIFRNLGCYNCAYRMAQKICTKVQVNPEFHVFHTQALSKDLFHLSWMKISLCVETAYHRFWAYEIIWHHLCVFFVRLILFQLLHWYVLVN